MSPQFPKGTPELKRTRRYKKNKEKNKENETRLAQQMIPSLKFKDKAAKTSKNIKNLSNVVNTRRSKRLQEKQQHFLFQNTMGFTPERTCVKVLVNDTPDNCIFPVVLRKLRESRTKTKSSR